MTTLVLSFQPFKDPMNGTGNLTRLLIVFTKVILVSQQHVIQGLSYVVIIKYVIC